MKKRRSDIAKLVSKSREVWRQSENYQQVKRDAKSTEKKGWFVCGLCGGVREVIKVDHVRAIGRQPRTMEEFGPWLEKLFCPVTNLMAVDSDCHKKKSKEERAKGAYK